MKKTIVRLALAVLLISSVLLAIGPGKMIYSVWRPSPQDLPLPAGLIAEKTAEGRQIIARVKSMDLSPLKQHFEAQQYGSYCGVASSVIVLNALGKTTSQDDFFIDGADQIRSGFDTFFGGMTVQQLAGLLALHGVDANAHHAADSSLDAFRDAARKNLAQPNDFVLVNYLRSAIDQQTGGHISPIGAYDEITDRFLVLDVATFKYPPVWVEAKALFDAMNTVDSDSGKTRGWVLVSTR